jgi:hypothetical protein
VCKKPARNIVKLFLNFPAAAEEETCHATTAECPKDANDNAASDAAADRLAQVPHARRHSTP